MVFPENLNVLETFMLVRWFVYHMEFPQREKLMSELPHIYNKLYNQEIVRVSRVSDGKPIK